MPSQQKRIQTPLVVHLLFLTLSAVTVYRSEAFASSHSRFATGRRLSFYKLRGGSEAQQQQQQQQHGSSTSSSSTSQSPLQCVMNMPPPVSAKGRSAGDEDGGGADETSKQVVKTTVVPNGTTIPVSSSSSSAAAASAADPLVQTEYVAETKLPTDIGQFQLRAYRVPGMPLGTEPCVIYARDKPPFGTGSGSSNELANHVPVRIHDQCLTSEVFRSQRCDCKEQLHMALSFIQIHGGCVIYLQQEGRGIGLANKVAAYALQDDGMDTVDANLHLGFPEDSREYGVVPSILKDMKIGSIQLMTNNPRKVERLSSLGINVERTLPMVVPQTNQFNRKYLETKQDRMNHANLSELLMSDEALAPTNNSNSNMGMAPRKPVAERYINNGTEMGANAVQVSLLVDADDQVADEEEAGVVASEDGYCFGKQSVVDALDAVGRGEMVVVVDDMDRENEGDFIMAADQCTPLDMAQIVRYSSGVVCVAMEGDLMDELGLPPMLTNNEDPKGTAFSVTVDATKEHGITTGISASDRSKTIQMLANPTSGAVDFHRPGHIFPLRAREGGVLTRDGHTEASIDLARIAGRSPVGVLCEIVSEENPTEMMRLPEIKRFCKQHGFVLTSIVDIAQYRRETEQ